ncbi:MAG TPA: cysteine desulfurase family protein [Micromonospora sp.]
MAVIYLDNCSTTRVHDEVVDAMLPYLREDFGNPSSPHVLGKRARRAVDGALERIAALVGSRPTDLVLTSGATESNNLVLQGLFPDRLPDDEDRAAAVLCPIDHKSALEVGRALADRGVPVRTMSVGPDGRVDLTSLAEVVGTDARVASVAWVNSEIGTVQPVDRIARICHDGGCLLHVDAAQAVGRIPVDVTATGVDTVAFTAHKIHGPKGIGALYVDPAVRPRLRPLLFGGGQFPLRSGTIATHLVVGFGKAAELALERLAENRHRVTELRETAVKRLAAHVPEMRLNGDPSVAVPHVINVVLPGIRGESLIAGLGTVAVSTGSACNSASQKPSHVLLEIGVDEEDANSSIRICLDPRMPAEELVRGIDLLGGRVRRLTGLDPLDPAELAG